jgi:hypothetical protein
MAHHGLASDTHFVTFRVTVQDVYRVLGAMDLYGPGALDGLLDCGAVPSGVLDNGSRCVSSLSAGPAGGPANVRRCNSVRACVTEALCTKHILHHQ